MLIPFTMTPITREPEDGISPIAHGLMLLGLCALGAPPISSELTDSMVAMLGNDVRHKRPAFIGDTVTPQFTERPSGSSR